MMQNLSITCLLILMGLTKLNAQQPKNSWNKNQVIAHRGAWKKNNLPENSIASLQQAIELNCYGSEFDVHLTLDSVIVVNHDDTFLGLKISSSTFKELLAKKLTNGENIPTLKAYLMEGMKQRKTKLILEIKPQNLGEERDLFLAASVLQMVRNLKAERWIDYISFGYNICTYIIENEPKANVAYLKGDIAPEKLKEAGFTDVDYHFSVYQNNPDYVEKFKKLGIKINGWTANMAEEINFLINNKVDFITTNEPELVFELVKKSKL